MDDSSYFLARPEQVKISLTNACNYRCLMCYNPKLKQERGFIPDALLLRILDECRDEGIARVALGATGEPLLHKRYLTYLREAKARGLWVSTTSNCTGLTEEVAQGMIELGLDRLNISLYSANRDQHFKYTGTQTFDKVFFQVKRFLALWAETGRKIKINMWFLDIPGVNSYSEYLELWKPFCDSIGLDLPRKDPINWSGRSDLLFGKTPKRRISLVRTDEGRCLRWWMRQPCGHVRSYLHVLHTGEVVPCCNISEVGSHAEILFGNTNVDRLMEIWQSARYLAFKRCQEALDVEGYGPCKVCSDLWRGHRVRLSVKHALATVRARFVQ